MRSFVFFLFLLSTVATAPANVDFHKTIEQLIQQTIGMSLEELSKSIFAVTPKIPRFSQTSPVTGAKRTTLQPPPATTFSDVPQATLAPEETNSDAATEALVTSMYSVTSGEAVDSYSTSAGVTEGENVESDILTTPI